MHFSRSKRTFFRLATATLSVMALTAATAAQTAVAKTTPNQGQHQNRPRPAPGRKPNGQVKAEMQASALARATNRPVPVRTLTTGTSTTVATPAGGFTTKTYVLPVRVKTADGWRPLNAALAKAKSGRLVPSATASGLSLSSGGASPLAVLTSVTGGKFGLGLPMRLPAPTISGATATYRSVAPGVSLTVTASKLGGLTITVDASSAAHEQQILKSLALGLRTQSLHVTTDRYGNFRATAPNGKAEFSGTAPALFGARALSAGRAASAGRTPKKPAPVRITITPDDFTSSTDSVKSDVNPNSVGTQGAAGCTGAMNYDTDDSTGGNAIGFNYWPSGCDGPNHAYYVLGLSGLNSAMQVQNATLQMWQTFDSDESCTDTWPVSLYDLGRGALIGASTDWSNQPALTAGELVKTTQVTPIEECPNNNAEIDYNVTSTFETAVTASPIWQNWTFGLDGDEQFPSQGIPSTCAPASSFNCGHMAIGPNPDVIVTFDLVPQVPSATQESPAPVGDPAHPYGCFATGPYGWIDGTSVTLQTTLTSDISGENVGGIFSVTDDNAVNKTNNNWSPTSAYISSGSRTNTSASTASHSILNGHQYSWTAQAQVSDGGQDGQNGNPTTYNSASSASCTFNIDTGTPTGLAVSSTAFPPSGSGLASTDAGGAGTFSFSAADPVPTGTTCSPSPCLSSGVAKFLYSLNTPIPTSGATSVNASANSNGSTATGSISLTIGNWGTNTLFVAAEDNAGNISPSVPYSFYAPWNPSTIVKPGDINADHIPDMLLTTGTNLDMLPGNGDPGVTPIDAADEAQSPDGTPWDTFEVTHRGSFNQSGVDDLFAHKEGNLYLILNHPLDLGVAPQFNNYGSNVTTIATHPACSATQRTGNCTGYDAGQNWDSVSNVLAPGDVWTGAPATGSASCVASNINCDTGLPSLIVAEGGEVWAYQGEFGNALGNPVLLGKIASNGSGWGNMTLIAPGVVGGVLTLWVLDDVTGIIYSYPISIASDGLPTINPSGASTPVTMDSGTAMLNVNFVQDTWASVASPGPLNNSSFPGLYAETTVGNAPSGSPCSPAGTLNACLYFYPGESTAGGASPLKTTPTFVGILKIGATEIS